MTTNAQLADYVFTRNYSQLRRALRADNTLKDAIIQTHDHPQVKREMPLLHLAIQAEAGQKYDGSEDSCVKILMDAGAKTHATNYHIPALHYAFQLNAPETARFLLTYPRVDPQEPGLNGGTILHTAVRALTDNADPDGPPVNVDAIRLACKHVDPNRRQRNGSGSHVLKLLDYMRLPKARPLGADRHQRLRYALTAALVEGGVDPNLPRETNDNLPLSHAVLMNDKEQISTLLWMGADPHAEHPTNEDGSAVAFIKELCNEDVGKPALETWEATVREIHKEARDFALQGCRDNNITLGLFRDDTLLHTARAYAVHGAIDAFFTPERVQRFGAGECVKLMNRLIEHLPDYAAKNLNPVAFQRDMALSRPETSALVQHVRGGTSPEMHP